jgi:hypothetical protein
MLRGIATANAVMEWPEGKENWPGGSRVAQQCGSSAQGRGRPTDFLRMLNSRIPVAAAMAAARKAARLCDHPRRVAG